MTILILGAQCLEIYKAKSDRNKNKIRQFTVRVGDFKYTCFDHC